MTPSTRIYCTTYLATGGSMILAAGSLLRDGRPLWATFVFAAVALALVLAVFREHDHDLEVRALTTRLEHAVRPPLPRRRLTPAQEDEAVLALTDACCERWWTSIGQEHDETCTGWARDRRDPATEGTPTSTSDDPAGVHDLPQED